MRFPGAKPKAVTLSYDDGFLQDIRFSNVISRYGLKCTFNYNGDSMSGAHVMKTEDVAKHILGMGHEVAIHGCNHRANGFLSSIEGIQEVLYCRLELERKFGRIIRGMAYPDSGVNRFANNSNYEKVKNYLVELDIAYARTAGGSNNLFEMPTDWYAWTPTAHHDDPEIMNYIDAFVGLDFSENTYIASIRPRLFYVWGHSFEFERKDNWEHLEEICMKLSGKEDVWYATNIEIYDYVKAYNSLKFSADGTMVYNPTLYTIWFNVDRKDYFVKSGETIIIEP